VAATDITATHGDRKVLHGVSITLRDGECVAVVGESGSGKTTLARCLIGLHRNYSGEITFKGEALAKRARDRPELARQRLQYIFQSPYGSLNPRQLCGDIIALPISLFDGLKRREARELTNQTLERVGLPSRTAERYPDELSGGERQRVAIARALVCRPEVLICDEVTSALDVSVQATILELLRLLQQEDGLSMAFITHNLAVVRNIADRVIVMHDGSIVEGGEVSSILDHPQEAYTERLLADTPTMPTPTAA
jgi:peptide/nickel transport system ATP-binding protein